VAVICTVAFPVFVASVVEVKITALPMVLPAQGACHGDSMGGSRGFFVGEQDSNIFLKKWEFYGSCFFIVVKQWQFCEILWFMHVFFGCGEEYGHLMVLLQVFMLHCG
jgi:hypothetical protein